MMVNEIFTSIEGEGIRAGKVCTFIRFTGCNLRCSWCDTRYSFHEGTEMCCLEVLKKVPSDARYVTLTGGEPLLQIEEETDKLVEGLLERGVEVNFETNGSRDFSRYLRDGIIITADYKLPSSGMTQRMDLPVLSKLRTCDVLKFVAASAEDLAEIERVVAELRPVCHVYVSPVFGSMEPADLAEWLKGTDIKNYTDIRMQIQLHKVVWPPEMRGV